MASNQSGYQNSTQQSSTVSTGRGGGASTSQSWSGIDPAIMNQYMTALTQAMNGGDATYQNQVAKRNSVINETKQMMQGYTKDAALSDGAALMKLNLQQSMEKQMPAIARSIQGAGTSSSSMQGLLSQKLATDSSLAASALGADQIAKYGSISANLSGVLNNLTAIDPTLSNLVGSLINSGKLTTSSTQSTNFNNTDSYSQSTGSSVGGSSGSSTDPANSGRSSGSGSGGGWSNGGGGNTSSTLRPSGTNSGGSNGTSLYDPNDYDPFDFTPEATEDPYDPYEDTGNGGGYIPEIPETDYSGDDPYYTGDYGGDDYYYEY